MSNISKKQHYVPEMVLKHFCTDKNKCWELNFNSGRIAKKSIREVCCTNQLYEIRDEIGEYYYPKGVNAVEKGFCRIETFYDNHINKLISELDKKEVIVLDSIEREYIYLWVSILLNRNPIIKQALPVVASDFGVTIKGEISQSYSFIEIMPASIKFFVEKFKKGRIKFLKTDKNNPFVISDIPVVILDPNCEECYMPLSSIYAIQIKKTDSVLIDLNNCEIQELSNKETDDYNTLMYQAVCAYRYSEFCFGNSVISSNKYTLDRLSTLFV